MSRNGVKETQPDEGVHAERLTHSALAQSLFHQGTHWTQTGCHDEQE